MITAEQVHKMNPVQWERLLADGLPLAPSDLEGCSFRGTSLGLPPAVIAATWTTFRKSFVRAPEGVRGWNVRIDQSSLRPMIRRGVPLTFGPFLVRPVHEYSLPSGAMPREGVVLDYAKGGGPRLDPVRMTRDIVVSLEEPSDLLFGWMYAALSGGVRWGTPSFFTLEREGPVEYVAPAP